MKKQNGSVERRVLGFIREHQLMGGVRRLLVAVSGGPDSVCLLHVLASLREELGLELHVAHLDHQLRGADSQADARYAERLARQLGLPATVEARDVRTYRTKRRISLEEAAREVRYAFLAEVTQSVDAQAVAVGHTRDDNAETIIMHLIRGTGTGGLRGLVPVNGLRTSAGSLKVVRPLLDVTRRETATYCIQHGLAPRTDETNRSLSLLRNRIRLELVPVLRKYNPQIEDALARTARIAGDELAFLDEEAERTRDAVATRNGQSIVLGKERFLALHPALKRHILRVAIGRLIGDLKDIEARHIEELLEAIQKPAGRAFQLPYGLVFVVEYDRYLLGRDTVSLCPFPPLESEFSLRVPGETIASGWKVTANVLPGMAEGLALPVPSGELRGISPDANERQLVACLDYVRAGDKLTVRSVKPGDRFEPMGLGASKKVGEFMLDAKIPRSWRKRVPIVVTPEQVVWVVGWRIDERAQVTDNTRAVLCLDFSRL